MIFGLIYKKDLVKRNLVKKKKEKKLVITESQGPFLKTKIYIIDVLKTKMNT